MFKAYRQDKSLTFGFKQARAITKKFATVFYFASLALPKKTKELSYAIYAVCRTLDECVDSQNAINTPERLKKLEDKINSVYSSAELKEEILIAFRYAVKYCDIPKGYFEELIKGMRMDLEISRYDNFEQLYAYCFRVAGIIGLIMIKIFGHTDAKAEKFAVDLGIAMQLTNILRDIKEDALKGRIYLPLDELKHYRVTEGLIMEEENTEDFKALIRFQIKRAREYYASSSYGINMIKGLRARLVICLMKEIYAAILSLIENNDYDTFSKRAHVNGLQKAILACKVLIKGEYL